MTNFFHGERRKEGEMVFDSSVSTPLCLFYAMAPNALLFPVVLSPISNCRKKVAGECVDSLILCSIPCGCVSIMVFVWTVGRLKWYTNNENIMIRIITLSTVEWHQDISFPESKLNMK